MLTGWTPKGRQRLDIHEICRKSQAPHWKWADPCNYLLLGRRAHESDLIAISGRESHIIQLALKKFRDPDNFDLQKWLELRNPNAMQYISMEEIDAVVLEEIPEFVK